MKQVFTALLLKEVQLPDDLLPKDTEIKVDIESSVALWNEIHFDVFSDEYSILN